MYFAAIDTESLQNPTIINRFKQVQVIVEYEPKSEADKYHHVFLLKIPESQINSLVKTMSDKIKTGWYAFFWSERDDKIVYKDIVFGDLDQAIQYGKKQGIGKEFLDLKRYLKRYKQHVLDNSFNIK